MRLDHVSYAAESDGMHATAARLGERLGITPVDGGNHPRFGTRNMILPLSDIRYMEVVEVLDHPACDKEPFGQAVRARSEVGGGWFGWAVSTDDLDEPAKRLDKVPFPGRRHTPDGVQLAWQQLGIKGLLNDPQLPFYVQWESDPKHHPALMQTTGEAPELVGMQIAGDPERVRHWLGIQDNPNRDWEGQIDFDFVAPHGTPGIMAITFRRSDGELVTV